MIGYIILILNIIIVLLMLLKFSLFLYKKFFYYEENHRPLDIREVRKFIEENKENIKYVDEIVRFCPNKYEIFCFMFNSRDCFSYDEVNSKLIIFFHQKEIIFRGTTYSVSAFQIYKILNGYKIKKDSNYDSYDEYTNAKSLYRKYKGQINE